MGETRLVSIIVATYNSGNTILETLDSIYNQTYKNIELIVTDDCSKDDSVNIATSWLGEHHDRFKNVRMITAPQNTGVSSNFNRGLLASSGEWIKPFAGDDILCPTYVEEMLQYGRESDMIICDLERFFEDRIFPTGKSKLSILESVSPNARKKLYARTSFFCNVPSLMIKRSVYDKIGIYDEKCKYFEDMPFLMNFFAEDFNIKYLDKKLVRYRQNGLSNQMDIKKALNFQKLLIEVFDTYQRPSLSILNPIDAMAIFNKHLLRFIIKYDCHFLLKLYLSKYNIFNRCLNKIAFRFVNL